MWHIAMPLAGVVHSIIRRPHQLHQRVTSESIPWQCYAAVSRGKVPEKLRYVIRKIGAISPAPCRI